MKKLLDFSYCEVGNNTFAIFHNGKQIGIIQATDQDVFELLNQMKYEPRVSYDI